MTDKYVQPGEQIDVTAGAAVTQGTIYRGTNRAGVYLNTGVTGDAVPVAYTGVFTLSKAADAVTRDQYLYATTGLTVTTTATGNVPIGYAAEAAATGATTINVALNGF